MTDCFELYSARVGLLAVVASFEAALGAFIATLEAGGHVIGKLGGYKHRIEWAFETVSHSTFPDAEMRARIPDNCADVEHARRIRNVFMHRNGAIDDRYLEERSRLEWIQHRTNSQWLNDKWIILHPPDFLEFVKSHIELLHILHDSIQTEYYGQTEPYDYRRAQKALEWHRILVGV